MYRLTAVKAHKTTVIARERDLLAREAVLLEKESKLTETLTQRDAEISSLRSVIATAESTLQARVRDAVLSREEELRHLVARKEAELATTLTLREQEIMAAVNRREEEASKMWASWAAGVKQEAMQVMEERMRWVHQHTEELETERERLLAFKQELDERAEQLSQKKSVVGEVKAKSPLEEVKNILAPLAKLTEPVEQQTPAKQSQYLKPIPQETPVPRSAMPLQEPHSAMKGVILTSTGEVLPTPSPADISKLFVATPRVTLNFTQIFDFDSDAEDSGQEDDKTDRGSETDTQPPCAKSDTLKSDLEVTPTQATSASTMIASRTTRLRRPSIRSAGRKPSADGLKGQKASASASSSRRPRQPSPPIRKASAPPSSQPPAEYDLSDEENLPSPFLKKIDRERLTRTTSVPVTTTGGGISAIRNAPRKSGTTLRALAVVNAARGASGKTKFASASTATSRPSITKAQKASEEARKALTRS